MSTDPRNLEEKKEMEDERIESRYRGVYERSQTTI
jgi:hypothetical protein